MRLRLDRIRWAALPLLFAGTWLLLGQLDLDALVAITGAWAAPVFVLAFVLFTPTLFPDSVFAALAGATFGALPGTLLVSGAQVVTAALLFPLTRRWLKPHGEALARRHAKIAALRGVIAQGGWGACALLRLSPLNPALLDYVLAASGVRFYPYLFSSIAHAPAYFVAAYVGSLTHSSAAESSWSVQALSATGCVIAALGTALALRELRRRSASHVTAIRRNP